MTVSVRLGLRGKILLLAGAILALAAGSNLVLWVRLRSAGEAVDRQRELVTEQDALVDEQGRLLEEQRALVRGQSSALERQEQAMAEQRSARMRLQRSREIRDEFARMSRWLADLAVSQLNESEASVDEAHRRLLELLAGLDGADRDAARGLEQDLTTYRTRMIEAVDAYAEDNRVLGNSLASEARRLGVEIEARIERLAALAGSAEEGASATVERASQEIAASVAGVGASMERLGRSGEELRAKAGGVGDGHGTGDGRVHEGGEGPAAEGGLAARRGEAGGRGAQEERGDERGERRAARVEHRGAEHGVTSGCWAAAARARGPGEPRTR